MTPPAIAVVGGGIAGLSAAYFLEKFSPTPIRIVLYEKSRRLGGLIETVRWDDVIIEKGPEALVSYKPSGIELAKALGLEPSFIGSKIENQKTFILAHGKLIRLPSGILSPFHRSVAAHAATFAFSPLLSIFGKIRMILEPLVPKKSDSNDESIRRFVTRRMGHEFYSALVLPLLSGVYGKNPGDLSAQTVLKELVAAENRYGGITKALFKSKRKKSGNKSLFISFKNGLDELTQKLQQSLRSTEIRLNQEVDRIDKVPEGYSISGEKFDALLLTTPAYASGRLIETIDHELALLLYDIPYSSATIFTYAFRRDAVLHPLKGHGFLVSPAEHLPIHACTWTTSKWDYRAPSDTVLIRAYAPLLLSDESIDEQVLESLKSILSIEGEPLFMEKFILPQSMPFYRVGHQTTIQKIKQRLSAHPGLFLAGAAYEGVGISDCIDSARRAVDAALQRIQSKKG